MHTRRLPRRLEVFAVVLAALVAGSGPGCVQEPMGARFCAQVEPPCDCNSGRDGGAVVVRWRISDKQVGRLLPRGECCCNPDPEPKSEAVRAQCGSFGTDCLDAPAWLIRNVKLRITSAERRDSCVVTAPCSNGELTTEYCLTPGLYDLQLVADVEKLDPNKPPEQTEFICANRPATSPPALRRMVRAGQTVNLDGVVLGINSSTIVELQDGGAGD